MKLAIASALLAVLLAPAALAGDESMPLAPGSLAPSAAEPPVVAYPVAAPPVTAPPVVAMPADECPGCPAPRQYDSHEIIKKIREIDHSRVINTTTVVPIYRRAPEPERLYVRPTTTVVNFVTHRYKVTEHPVGFAAVPVQQRAKSCYGGRYGSCRPLRVRG
jgi:hypothetical protein